MNYVYTSARVSALYNKLLSRDTIEQLISCTDARECIRILNSCGIAGGNTDEILSFAENNKADTTSQLIDDLSEIEVIFYEKSFHNLKAAVKRLYMHGVIENVYCNAPIEGKFIEKCISNSNFGALPEYMSTAAEEAYKTILKTGDGQLSDIVVDKSCLLAMLKFAEKTKHEILKKYVYETVAAADIKTAVRFVGEDAEKIQTALVDCPYFTAEALANAAEDKKSLEEFLKGIGFSDIDIDNIDRMSAERILRIVSAEKYNIFTPSPVIDFILALERQYNLIRLILVCKENGVSENFIRRKAVRGDV